MIASLLSVARNDNFDYIHAFSYALKNQFEIISRNENYAFNHNNFYHNGNNRIWRLPRLLAKGTPTETKSRNDDFIVCNNGLLSINNGLFSRNDYGGNFIFGFWSNSNFGFLFNRKINSKKNFISEGEKTMKKIFLTTIALLTMASASVFGMYGPDSDWITFLTDGNRFRARADQLGFTLGNDMIKGTFGFRNKGFGGAFGNMLNTTNGAYYNFDPTISMGLAYTSSLISVGVGYNATIGQRWNRYNGKDTSKKVEAVAHTPVLVLNALDNAFRMAIPIQVVHLTDKMDGVGKGSVTAVSLDAQFRYYTGLDFLPQIRLYIIYGSYGYELSPEVGDKIKGKFAESFGFDFRLWFGSMVEEVALNPIIKIQYNQALGRQHNQTRIQAANLVDNAASNNPYSLARSVIAGRSGTMPEGWRTRWGTGAYDLRIIPALGLTANSDIVSLYAEPSLGFRVNQQGSATQKNVKELMSLYWGAYAEIYITPLKNLEWYFEVDVNNGGTTADQSAITFASTTGITWYLPAL